MVSLLIRFNQLGFRRSAPKKPLSGLIFFLKVAILWWQHVVAYINLMTGTFSLPEVIRCPACGRIVFINIYEPVDTEYALVVAMLFL